MISVECSFMSAVCSKASRASQRRRTSFVYPEGCLAAMENPALRSGFPATARLFRAFKRLRAENAARLPHSDQRSTTSIFIYQMEGRGRGVAENDAFTEPWEKVDKPFARQGGRLAAGAGADGSVRVARRPGTEGRHAGGAPRQEEHRGRWLETWLRRAGISIWHPRAAWHHGHASVLCEVAKMRKPTI